jgi:DNA-binding HxlR family transcriptional regulator
LPANIYDPNCPTRALLDRIGDKWTVLVVLMLLDGPQRFSHLRDRIGGVAPKVLTQTLRSLERDGVVTRKAFAEVPPRVEYELTPLGRSLEEPIRLVTAWAEAHMSRITRARSTYDRRRAAKTVADEATGLHTPSAGGKQSPPLRRVASA